MGIYESCAPCGCIGETYTMYDPPKTAIKLRSVSYTHLTLPTKRIV